MRPPLDSFSEQVRGDVSVCYSGGLDSTTVAYLASRQQKGRVHLLTLDHGYGYVFNRWAKNSSASLARVIGRDRVVHRYIDTHALHREIAIRSLRADYERYGQGFGCCLGCTMAIVTEAVIYNLEHGIPHLMFGSSVGGQYAVMSMPAAIELQKGFLARYGMRYSTPLLDDHITKDVERATLRAAGITTGKRFLDKHSFGNQGYCLLSLQHLPDVLFNVHPTYDPDAVRRFYQDKLPICEAWIAERFRRQGHELAPLVDRVRALSGVPRAETP